MPIAALVVVPARKRNNLVVRVRVNHFQVGCRGVVGEDAALLRQTPGVTRAVGLVGCVGPVHGDQRRDQVAGRVVDVRGHGFEVGRGDGLQGEWHDD